jgi:glycosyltransferase involved in cell wall biosynthesis
LVVSVAIPVKNGARYLAEVLSALQRQRIDATIETIVLDSSSQDGSLDIARAAGVRVVEIEPESFGHGRTRNLAAELSQGAYIAFLTQDATPADDEWLSSLVGAFELAERVGMVYGPHHPRADTSPMIARELTEFFGRFSPDGRAVVQRSDSEPVGDLDAFFSNVNSCVSRECWEEIRFRDLPYAEDQAFARDAMAAGWCKVYEPRAAVRHAHDYPPLEFMRRYFDEYRGLRAATGHLEPFAPRAALRTVAAQVRNDLAFDSAGGRATRPSLAARSALHHGGRAVFAALGSRSDRLPARLQRRLSFEGTAPWEPGGRHGGDMIRVSRRPYAWSAVASSLKAGDAPLSGSSPHDGERKSLHVAWVIPPFRAGSGGHMTLLTLARELERMGHSCSVWLHDPGNEMPRRAAVAHGEIVESFAPLEGGVFKGFDDWFGADVAMATGWQTVYPLRGLGDCKLKAYLVQDFEPDFYPRSAESLWAEDTYRMGLPCICASPWLRDLLRRRYGADAEAFELAVHTEHYRDLGRPRDPDTVVFYARPATPRRGTELGVLALAEVLERRPQTRVVMFGDVVPPSAPFDYEFVGVVDHSRLAELYAKATVGLVISLTNYSLIPKEMMACGLPVVDIRGVSAESVFGPGGEVIALAEPEPEAIASEIVSLLEHPERRDRMAAAALERIEGLTWEAAAGTIEAFLRDRLRRRREREPLAGTAAEEAPAGAGEKAEAPTRDLLRRLS